MRPRGERKQSGHVGKANHDNADQLTNQSRRRGDGAINQSRTAPPSPPHAASPPALQSFGNMAEREQL